MKPPPDAQPEAQPNSKSNTSSNAPYQPPPEGQAHIRLQLIADPRYLESARELLSAFAARIGFDEHACLKIKLACDEGMTNIIRHGYGAPGLGPIRILVWPIGDLTTSGADGIYIQIEDDAPQVDPATIAPKDPCAVAADGRSGGRGVQIMQACMDHVSFAKGEHTGMRLTLIKHRRRGATSASASKKAADCGER